MFLCYSVNYMNVVVNKVWGIFSASMHISVLLICRGSKCLDGTVTPLVTFAANCARKFRGGILISHLTSSISAFRLGGRSIITWLRAAQSLLCSSTTFSPRVYSLKRIAGFQLPSSKSDALANPPRALQGGGERGRSTETRPARADDRGQSKHLTAGVVTINPAVVTNVAEVSVSFGCQNTVLVLHIRALLLSSGLFGKATNTAKGNFA